MLIIGCDYHPGFQQIALVDTETGELGERRLMRRAEAEQFYRELKEQNVRVGMEASGHARWFERLLHELQFELWIGDAAEIRTKRVRKQKTDRQAGGPHNPWVHHSILFCAIEWGCRTACVSPIHKLNSATRLLASFANSGIEMRPKNPRLSLSHPYVTCTLATTRVSKSS
jgi:hypothetical protein